MAQKPNIFLLERINDSGIEILAEFANVISKVGMSRTDILSSLYEADAVIIRSVTKIDKEFLDCSKNLKVIARAGTGTDNIDMDLAAQRNIPVVTTKSLNAISAAEYTIGQIICLIRNFYQSFEMKKESNFSRHMLEGRELGMLTVGVIGLGNIGYHVVKRLAVFEPKVIGYDPFQDKKDIFMDLGVKITNHLDYLLENSDVITIHASLNASSRHMINSDTLKRTKKGVVIVNAARAEIIEDEALLKSLDDGQVSAVATDVISPEPPYDKIISEKNIFEHPLLDHHKVVVTPHIAASTLDAQKKIALQLAGKIKEVFSNIYSLV